MVSGTRSSKKKAVEPSGNGRVSDAIANVNASERETEPHIEATGADGAETGTGSPARRSPTTKVRAPKKKKKTSLIWNHFTELLVEEKADGIVIMKKIVRCHCQCECNCGDSIMDLWVMMMVTNYGPRRGRRLGLRLLQASRGASRLVVLLPTVGCAIA